MKEFFDLAVVIAMAFGGTFMAKKIHDEVRDVALAKIAGGLPPMSGMSVIFSKEKQSKKKLGEKHYGDK